MKGKDNAPSALDQLRAAAPVKRVGRKCLTCESAHVDEINTLLREGMSEYAMETALEKAFSIRISHGAIANHRRRCLGILRG